MERNLLLLCAKNNKISKLLPAKSQHKLAHINEKCVSMRENFEGLDCCCALKMHLRRRGIQESGHDFSQKKVCDGDEWWWRVLIAFLSTAHTMRVHLFVYTSFTTLLCQSPSRARDNLASLAHDRARSHDSAKKSAASSLKAKMSLRPRVFS